MTFHNKIKVSGFGKLPLGEEAKLFTIKRGSITAKITNFGGIITELHIPDRNGNIADVVLGFKNIEAYLKENIYAGAIVGRIAGRLSNAEFIIDKTIYKVTKNERNHHVHGGHKGFDKRLWEAEIIKIGDYEALKLYYFSEDGEEGYPGNLKVSIIYSIDDDNGLKMEYHATTDKATPLSLTNHSYFNLAGEGNGDILNHLIKIDADYTVEVDENLLPTGKILPVINNVNNLKEEKLVKDIVSKVYLEHGDNYLVNTDEAVIKEVATIKESDSGRIMKVFSSAPNLQFYSGIGLNTLSKGKSGTKYSKFAGMCLECQGFSDALKHNNFESIILHANSVFHQTVIYRFKFTA